MHELALCDSIARTVNAHAGSKQVETIHLQIGALRQVVPETLSYCWTIVCSGRHLDGSVLEIEVVPGQVACDDCAALTVLDRFFLACSQCGGSATRVVAGEEFLITSIDVIDP